MKLLARPTCTISSAPVKPRVTSAPRVDGQNAQISWEPITEDDAHGYLTSIEIAYCPKRSENDDCENFDPTTLGDVTVIRNEQNLGSSVYNLTGLRADLEYCVAVRASTASGSSEYSNPTRITRESTVSCPLYFVSLNVYVKNSQKCSI